MAVRIPKRLSQLLDVPTPSTGKLLRWKSDGTMENVTADDILASLTSGMVTTALGYTPLKNITDTLAGDLTVTSSVLVPMVMAPTDTSLLLHGQVADSATAVGTVINNSVPLVDAAALLLSVRNGSTEKLNVDKDGGIYSKGSIIGDGAFYTSTLYARAAGGTLSLKGRVADGASAVGVVIDNSGALSTAGSLIVAFKNNGTTMATIDRNGSVVTPGVYVGAAGISTTGTQALKHSGTMADVAAAAHRFQNTTALTVAGAKIASFFNDAGVTEKAYIDKDGHGAFQTNLTFISGAPVIRSNVADSGTAVGFTFSTVNSLANATSKLASFSNSGTEKAYISKDGNIYSSAGFFSAFPGAAGTFRGAIADSASAVGVILDNTATLSTTGAKLLSVRNNGVEKAYIDCNGGILGGTVTSMGAFYTQNGSVYKGGAAGTLSLFGTVGDGSSAVATVLDNFGTTLSTVGSKLLSVRNNGVEKAYIDKDGAATFVSNVLAYYFMPSVTGNVLRLQGTVVDGSSAIACSINSSNALTIAGAKILSVQNAGVEKAYIDKDGSVVAAGGVGNFYGWNFGPATTGVAVLRGRATDGGTAVATKIMNVNALSTTGAKIISFYSDDGVTEKAYIDKDGAATFGGSVVTPNYCYATAGFAAGSGGSAKLLGRMADGGSAVGTILNNLTALTIAGAKLVSVQNNGAEKASIDKDGLITSAGSPVGRQVAVPATATSAGSPGDFACDTTFAYFCTVANTWRRVGVASW